MDTKGQDSRMNPEECRIQSTQQVSHHIAVNLGGRISVLEEALLQIMNQQLQVNAGQLELREIVQALSARPLDRKSTRLNSSHSGESRMPSSA